MSKNKEGDAFKSDNLFASFRCAFGGILYSLRRERNFRIHCAAAAYVLYFTRYYSFTRAELSLILLLLGLVMTCELFNTSIEKTVDLESPVYNPLAKIAKDVAAGAVLVSSLASIAVGVLLFWDPAVLRAVLADMLRYFVVWLLLGALTLAWIFLPQKLGRKHS